MAPPSRPGPPRSLLTVGHGTLEADALAALLHGAGVELLVDVRTAPGSRRLPQFGRPELERWLPDAGIAYAWERDLGGFRKASPSSVNLALRNASFRGYADYMETAPFWAALDRLLDRASGRQTAVMCSESLWWRCHRRLIADAVVLVKEIPVSHLMHRGDRAAHQVTSGARLTETKLVRYDVGATPTLSMGEPPADGSGGRART